MSYLFIIIVLAANILMASYHSHLMRQGKKIEHGWWALAYIILTLTFASGAKEWLLIPISFLLRKVVFDIALNLFNHRSPFFVSLETTSIVDKIHFKIFGKNSWVYYCIYFSGAIVLIILI